MGVQIEIAPGVFTPRDETETLGETVIKILRERSGRQLVVDMCCGTGNLACAVAKTIDDITIWAMDLTEQAAEVARRNVNRLGLADVIKVSHGDLFTPLDPQPLVSSIDLVMCNPPYISTSRLDGEKAYLVQSEPREAFDGGPYGLSIHQRVISEAVHFLKPGGWIALEIGQGQERQISALFKRSGGYAKEQHILDKRGISRVTVAQKLP
jgi:release factor glutamine methyltransferase